MALPVFDPTKPFEEITPQADVPRFDPDQPFEEIQPGQTIIPPSRIPKLDIPAIERPSFEVTPEAAAKILEQIQAPRNVRPAIQEETWQQLSATDKALQDLARGAQSAIRGVGRTPQGLVLQSATAAPMSPNDMGNPFDPTQAEMLSAWQRFRAQAPEARAQQIREHPLFKAGERVVATGERAFPSEQPPSVNRPAGALAEGVGSTLSFVPGMLSGPVGVAYLGALQSGAEAYSEAVLSGAPDDKAELAFFINAAGGTSEALPIARIFDRINKASGGTIGKALKQMVISGFEEGSQELFQQTLQNATAKHLYDEERQYLQGLAQSGGVGFGTGFLLSALGMGTAGAASRTGRAIRERKLERAALSAQQKYEQAVEKLERIRNANREQAPVAQTGQPEAGSVPGTGAAPTPTIPPPAGAGGGRVQVPTTPQVIQGTPGAAPTEEHLKVAKAVGLRADASWGASAIPGAPVPAPKWSFTLDNPKLPLTIQVDVGSTTEQVLKRMRATVSQAIETGMLTAEDVPENLQPQAAPKKAKPTATRWAHKVGDIYDEGMPEKIVAVKDKSSGTLNDEYTVQQFGELLSDTDVELILRDMTPDEIQKHQARLAQGNELAKELGIPTRPIPPVKKGVIPSGKKEVQKEGQEGLLTIPPSGRARPSRVARLRRMIGDIEARQERLQDLSERMGLDRLTPEQLRATGVPEGFIEDQDNIGDVISALERRKKVLAEQLKVAEQAAVYGVPEAKPAKSETKLPEGWTEADIKLLLSLVDEGKKILVADTALGIPTINQPKNGRHLGFGVFKATTPEYEIEFEAGGALSRTPSEKGYSVITESRGSYPYDFEAVKAKLRSYLETEKPAVKPAKAFGATNKVFTADAKEEALKRLRAKLGGTTYTGIDPTIFTDAVMVGGYYAEAGVRKFKDWSERMLKDVGEGIRPYLNVIYKAVRDWPEFDATGMDSDVEMAKERTADETSTSEPTGKRPVVPESADMDEGLPSGGAAGTGAKAGGTVPVGGSGSTVGAANTPSGPRKGSSIRGRPRSGSKRPVAGEQPTREPTGDEGQGVSKDRGDAEVRSGKDVEPTDNLRIQKDDKIVPDTRAGRIQANLRAMELSKKLSESNKLPTPAQKRVLMQFSGWGDTFQVFGMTQINQYYTAADVYEDEKKGRQIYNILYAPNDRTKYEKWKAQYAASYDTLKQALTEDEWNSAKESSLNAHYTSREGIEGLWDIVQRLGWPGGTAVESSAGIGHIMGLTPNDYAGKVHWIGIELDKLTGQMLSQLYPASDIQNSPFEKALRIENNSANLVISNFPFGDYPIADISHPDYDGWSIHNYFLARSVDVVKPGGLVVAITSRYTMDGAKGMAMRRWLAERADMIGAIRLPNTAFKASAGTEVVTDILIFRKKAGIGNLQGQRFTALATVDIPANQRTAKKEGESEAEYQERLAKPIAVNEYFVQHPEMVLGHHSTKGTMYATDSYTVAPKSDKSLKSQLNEAIALLPENIMHAEQDRMEDEDSREELRTIKGKKAESYVVEDGKVWQVDDQGRLQKPDWASNTAQVAIAKKLMGLRDAILQQIDVELSEDSTNEEIETGRKVLNRLYDDFVSKHGALNDKKNNLIDDDPEWPLVASLEDERSNAVEVERGGRKVVTFQSTYVKGPMLLRRVNFPHTEPSKADNLSDAVSISINYRGGIDPEFIGRLISIPTEEARQRVLTEELAYENPANGLLEQPDLYLSGFVKEKLEAARNAAGKDERFNRNVAALEKVQPAKLPADTIFFRLGSNWISSEQVKRFLRDVLEINASVMFVRAGDETRWVVGDPAESSTANLQRFSAGGKPGHTLVEDSLNLKMTEVTTTVEEMDVNGKPYKKTIVLPKETAAARDMQNQIQDEFRKWVLQSPQEATEVEDTYNRLFNGMVRREYPVPKLDRFPGASDAVTLNYWQKRAAVRCLQEATLVAHGVGTGKTFLEITVAMEMRRLGAAKKVPIVVQNSTLTQYANHFRRLYPTARIIVATAKATEAKKRQSFLARVATGDWDAVVMPMSFFERIPNDPKREQAYVHEQLDNLEAMIREAEGPKYQLGARPSSSLGKQLIKVKRRAEAHMNRILDRIKQKTDDLITWEKMGFDALILDEAHSMKRGDFITKMDRIKGLDTNGSDRSMDFLLKTQWIHMKSPDRNVILATGTPISNTLAELWTMLRYVRPNLLKRFNVETFDDFVGTFATTKATIEETPTGGFSQVLRLARYVNGPEIGQLWRAGADVYVLNRDDFKDAGINVPEIEGGIPTEVVIERPDATGRFVDFLRDWRLWWEDLEGKEKAELSYVPILQYGLARKAAIDLRLVNPRLADDPASKVNRVVNDVYNLWKNSSDPSGTQLIFSNLYRSHDPDKRWLDEDAHLPNPLYGVPVFHLFEDMRRKLIAKGIPANEIADFSTMTEPQRFATAEQVKAGTVRIAFGTTESLGTGLNLQDHIVAIHHIDPQFRPMDFEQRNGRAIRQGNQNKTVKIFVYGVKQTLDSTLYQLMLIKQKFIAQMMTADNLSREFDDPSDDSTMSFQAMAAAFSGNPLFAQRFALENDVRRLSILEEDYSRKRSDLRGELRQIQEGRRKFEDTVDALEKSKAALDKAFSGDEFTVQYKTQTAKGEDGKKLLDQVFTDAIGEMRRNLEEEYAAGELHETHSKEIKGDLKYRAPESMLSLPARERTRRVTINGIDIVLKLKQPSSIPLVADKGNLQLDDALGWWEMQGQNTADWSEDKPWYNSVNAITGHATTASGLQTSLAHTIKVMGERLAKVSDSRKRIEKVENDVRRELEKPFESANRLKEQTEKLNEVLQQLAASGIGTGQQQPPTIAEITAKFPELAYITRQVAAEGSAELVTQFNREDREKAKNAYFLVQSEGGFSVIKTARPVKLKGFEWIDAFIWFDKGAEKWRIADGATGKPLGSGKTEGEAKSYVEENLAGIGDEELRRKLKSIAMNTGLSPRAKARDGENANIFSKFQEGMVAVFERDGTRYVGTIKTINQDTGELAMEVSGNTIAVPARYVELASKEEQATWLARKQAADESDAGAASLAETSERGQMSPPEAADVIRAWQQEHPEAPQVEVVNRPEWTTIGADGNTYGVRGWWDGQRITVNLAYVPDATVLRSVLEHERTHPLLTSPEGQQAIARAIEAELGKNDLLKLQTRYPMQPGESRETYQRRVYAEWLSGLAERAPSVWQRIITRIREFLAKFKLVTLTDEEIGRALLRSLESGKPPVVRLSNATITSGPQMVSIRGGEAAVTAYHGTPHKVDRFTTAKIGTGEGAQVYGWGLYFAENEAVAKDYADKLGANAYPSIEKLRAFFKPGAIVPAYGGFDRVRHFVEDAKGWHVLVNEVRKDASGNWVDNGPVRAHHTAPDAKKLKSVGLDVGQQYTVRLNVEPEELLDWDKPLSEQSEKVKAQLSQSHHVSRFVNETFNARNATGKEIYNVIAHRANASLPPEQRAGATDAKAASAELSRLGIKGIRYLDQWSRIPKPTFLNGGWEVVTMNQVYAFRTEAQANRFWERARKRVTYNYVIFNDADIVITHENGQRVSVQEAAQSQMQGAASLTDEPVNQPFDVEAYEEAIARAVEAGEVPTTVMGYKDTVRARELLNRGAGAEFARQLFGSIGLDVTQRADGFFELTNPDVDQEADGERLLQKLVELKSDPASPIHRGEEGAGGNLINSVRLYMTRDDLGAFSPRLKRELYKVSQEEASHRGVMLAALRGNTQSVEYVARHVDVALNEEYSKEYGGEEVGKIVADLVDGIDDTITDAEIQAALNDSKKLKDLMDKVAGINAVTVLRDILRGKWYEKADIGKQLSKRLQDDFGVPKDQADAAAADFLRAFDAVFNNAVKRAIALLEKAMTADDRKRVGFGKKRGMWGRIVNAVTKGKFDKDWILQHLARLDGWTLPTDEEIQKVRELADKIDALKQPSAEAIERVRQQLRAQGITATPEDIAAMAPHGNVERIVELKRKIETYWSRWTKPITTRTPTGRSNLVQAGYEFTAANLLFKGGFLTRQTIDVLTQAISHMPTRAIGNAIVQHGGFWKNSTSTEFYADANEILKLAWKTQREALAPAIREFKEALKGTAEVKNVDRLLSGIALFEKLQMRADELQAQGKNAEAMTLRLFGLIRFSYRFASAMDNLQGVPQEWQEIRTQAYRHFRLQGMSPAEASQKVMEIIPDLKATYMRAVPLAKAILEQTDESPTKARLESGAWHIVKGLAYQRMKEAGMPSDEHEARNRLLRSTTGWNESMTGVTSPGGVASTIIKAIGNYGVRFPPAAILTTPFGRFGNAIGTSMDRVLTFFGGGFFPAAFGAGEKYVDPETGLAGRGASPWYRTREDRAQRAVEAMVGTALNGILIALVLGGYIVVRNRWPKDKEEKELWEANGWKPGQAAIQLGDGKEIQISMNTGPLALVRPSLAASGALVDRWQEQAKKQNRLNADAARKGLPPGKVPGLGLADMMAIAGEAAWASIVGSRTASGLIGTITDYGLPNAQKQIAGTISPFVPTLPGIQEVSRMAGVQLESRAATVLDFLLPLPTSGARKVNMLGDPAGTHNDLQRVIQILTGGTYPGITSQQAAQAREGYSALFSSGYRPPSIDPNRGYAFPDQYRPMSETELASYTQNRGDEFKRELASIGPEPSLADVKAAYQRANARALASVGVTTMKPTVSQTETPRMGLPSLAAPDRSFTPRPTSARGRSLTSRIRRPRRPRLGRASTVRRRSLRPGRALRLPRSRFRSFRSRRIVV